MADMDVDMDPVPEPEVGVSSTIEHVDRRTHILMRPDNYIGENTYDTQFIVVLNEEGVASKSELPFSPGLRQIFTEPLANMRDRIFVDPTCTIADVSTDGTSIAMRNNGYGIPCSAVTIKEDNGTERSIRQPELAFSVFQSSSNYDDSQQRVTGGRNGMGCKLTNVLSRSFTVETIDGETGEKFTQSFSDNMGTKSKPKVRKVKGKPFTKITFQPDLAALKVPADTSLSAFTDQMHTWVAEMAACTLGTINKSKTVTFKWNGKKTIMKSFKQLATAYMGPDCIFDECAPRDGLLPFQLALAKKEEGAVLQDDRGFVNGVPCNEGTLHNHIRYRVYEKIKELVPDFNSFAQLFNSCTIMYNALVYNPSFDSQNKTQLTTKNKDWGFTWTPSDSFCNKLKKSSLVAEMKRHADDRNELKKLREQSNRVKEVTTKVKGRSIANVASLIDAAKAGYKSRKETTTLWIAEGNSAQSWIVSGLPNQDFHGVLAVRGKSLNLYKAKEEKKNNNVEINNLLAALGLQVGVDYSKPRNRKSLRYDRVVVAADNDKDGIHIRMQILSNLLYLNPTLQSFPFLHVLITPLIILKPRAKRLDDLYFYSDQSFEEWCAINQVGKYEISYTKGLGAMDESDARKFVKERYVKRYRFEDGTKQIMVDMMGEDSAKRKDMLRSYDGDAHIPYEQYIAEEKEELSFADFVRLEYPQYCMADLKRKIPNVVDGLIPSQRKVIWTLLKKGITDVVRCDQLAGEVQKFTAYHHGETSLPIMPLARDHVGANNVSVVKKRGIFGSWLSKDSAAAPRYARAGLEDFGYLFWPKADFASLTMLVDDGQEIEPVYMPPVICWTLLNFRKGLATGWNTVLPGYNPIKVLELTRELTRVMEDSSLRGEFEARCDASVPFFDMYTGSVKKTKPFTYETEGVACIEGVEDDMVLVRITQLPVPCWVDDYVKSLQARSPTGSSKSHRYVKFVQSNSSNTEIRLLVGIDKTFFDKHIGENKDALFKYLLLKNSINVKHRNMWRADGTFHKFSGIAEVLYEYGKAREQLYRKRLTIQLQSVKKEVEYAKSKMQFVRGVIDGTLVLFHRDAKDVERELAERKVPEKDESYDYLLNIPARSFTSKEVSKQGAKVQKLAAEQRALEGANVFDVWRSEIDALEPALRRYLEEKRVRCFGR